MGRHEDRLQQTAAPLSKRHPEVQVDVIVADVTQEASLEKLVGSLESWDVLVQGAGYMNNPATAAKCDMDDYWKAFEVCSPLPYRCISFIYQTKGH